MPGYKDQKTHVFISLGSNMGDKLSLLKQATETLVQQIGPVVHQSSIYQTEPWGNSDQEWFYNVVIELTTSHSARQVLERLQAIESSMGRVRQVVYGPRPIDLDLLFYGELIINEPDLIVPHPQIINRNFVLVPLMEIAGELVHPVTGITIEEHYWASPDSLEVITLEENDESA
jgi:2-amino-4-hydroxy-6-hydroxymethyldihydropteridine diphosphokinase